MLLATRVLKLQGSDGTVEIPIRLFAPEQGEPSGWFCRFEIDWPHGMAKKKAWGFDAIQAIHLTLQMIGADIYFSEYHKSGKLMLDGPGKGYGFPVPKNARDLLIGDDARFDG